MKKETNDRQFTLIELFTVVAMLDIIVLIAAPKSAWYIYVMLKICHVKAKGENQII